MAVGCAKSGGGRNRQKWQHYFVIRKGVELTRMNRLPERDQRLLKFAAIGIVVYLALFYGRQFFEKRRTEYRQLVTQAQDLRQKNQPYADRILVVKKLMDDFHLDPAKLQKALVVADASAAIQNAAKTGGVALGPIRESEANTSGKQLATVQLEGTGTVPAVLTFLSGLDRIGFPLIVDSVQFTANNNQPGQLKINLTILILDFEQWKGVPHA
jgi:hypothetical protein